MPQRWQKSVRAVLIVLAAAFVAFEFSRFWLAAALLAPLWRQSAASVSVILSFSPLAMVVSFAVALAAFALPLIGLFCLWRLVLKRRSVKAPLTKVNFR